MVLTPLETELRQLARHRIVNGQLTHAAPTRMWGGQGTGRACLLCNRPIAEAEIEVEQVLDGKLQTFQFHVFCQSLWQLECAREYHVSGVDAWSRPARNFAQDVERDSPRGNET